MPVDKQGAATQSYRHVRPKATVIRRKRDPSLPLSQLDPRPIATGKGGPELPPFSTWDLKLRFRSLTRDPELPRFR